jgi:peptide/nickel transport system substrate-binding protein
MLAAAACLVPATADAVRNPVPGTTVTVTAAGAVSSLDPAQAGSPAERLLVAQLFDRVTRRGADGTILPSLAASWSAGADSLEWTFTLSPGLTFADGRPLDAAAIVASWNRIGSDAPDPHRIPGLAARADGPRLVVRLDRPVADLLLRLADPLYGVAAPVAGPDGGSLAGSGPFRLVRSDEPGVFVLAPRLSHPRGRPMPGRVLVRTDPGAPGESPAIRGLDTVLGWVRDPLSGTVDFSLAWTPGPVTPTPGRPARSSR